ncbi:MAG TPA: hypothetical protein PKE16_09865 [Hyphomicrobium sp.]|nr:hypothetical protein [Hyphomicrobium sp.]
MIEITRRRLDWYEERDDRPFFDKLFAPHAKPTMTFRRLEDICLADKTEEFDVNNDSKKRLDKITAIADCLSEIIGEATPVQRIDDDHMQRVRSLLAKCPANRLEIYPKLSRADAVVQAAKQGKLTLSPISGNASLTARAAASIGASAPVSATGLNIGHWSTGGLQVDYTAQELQQRP